MYASSLVTGPQPIQGSFALHSVNTLNQQVERAYDQYKSRESDLRKNSFLQSLKGRLSPWDQLITL